MGVMREAPETQNWVGSGSGSGSGSGTGIAELVKVLPKWLMNMSTETWLQVREWEWGTIEYCRY